MHSAAARNVLFDLASILSDVPHHQSIVIAKRFFCGYLLGQSKVRRVVFGNHKHAGSILVQTMDDTGTDLPIDAAEIGNAVQKRVDQRAVRRAARGMGNHALRLVHNDDVIVFIYNVDRDILRLCRDGTRFGYIHGDHVTNTDLHTGFGLRFSV